MGPLPRPPDVDAYFAHVYGLPPPAWAPALAVVAARHGFTDGPWERAALGRNVVFVGPEVAVKLGPPFWAGEMAREAAALRFVAGRLPARTPAPLAHGALDGWEYLAVARLPGIQLSDCWADLPPAERAGLAQQHGALMAALHALPVAAVPGALRRDWAPFAVEQRALCLAAMERSGVAPGLLASAEPFLDAVMPRLLAAPPALIHGDLCHLNILVERADNGWRIAALIDWGDSNMGPVAYDLISPAVHMYRGDRDALAAWYHGYGLGGRLPAPLAYAATAWAMLHYADELGAILQRIPNAAAAGNWHEVAHCLWGPTRGA